MQTKLRENQDRFIQDMAELSSWSDRFNYMIDLSNELDIQCPGNLLHFRLENCRSQSYFRAELSDGKLRVKVWSNASVMRGMMACVVRIFDGLTPEDWVHTEIDFHSKSGLIDNLTPLRQYGLLEMLNRIMNVLK